MPPHTTAGGGCVKRRTAAADLWPKLPDDLLGDVYARLDTLLDRVRFAAACSSWHAATSTHRRPVLPWLLPDPSGYDKAQRMHMHCYCPEYGTVLRHVPIPLPTDFVGRSLVGCHDGGWVAWYDDELGIMNLSGVKVALSAKQRRKIRIQHCVENTRKLIFSSPPTSDGCILAAITSQDDVAVCRLSHPEAGWSTRKLLCDRKLVDIAFHGGELYGLTRYSRRLLKFIIGVSKRGTLVFRTVVWATIPNPYPKRSIADEYGRYMLALAGKLVMVTRYREKPFFMVHELVEADMGMKNPTCKWVEVTSLGDHSMFVGATCFKAVRVAAGGPRCGGVKRNHIYYFQHNPRFHRSFNDSGHVYDKEEEYIWWPYVKGIGSVGYHVYAAQPPAWLLPPDI